MPEWYRSRAAPCPSQLILGLAAPVSSLHVHLNGAARLDDDPWIGARVLNAHPKSLHAAALPLESTAS